MQKTTLININSSGKTIEVKVGGEIQIELSAIGSAGYGWYFDQLDDDLFELIGEDRKVMTKKGEDMVGTPVISVFKIRAKKPGSSIIKMSLYRVWEGRNKAINQFEVSFDITP